jgi:hypothetical protein
MKVDIHNEKKTPSGKNKRIAISNQNNIFAKLYQGTID